MHHPLAERELTFRATGSDHEQPVWLRIGHPTLTHATPPIYAVQYEIDGPGDHHHESSAYGADALHALTIVLGVVNTHIDVIRKDGILMWEGSDRQVRFEVA